MIDIIIYMIDIIYNNIYNINITMHVVKYNSDSTFPSSLESDRSSNASMSSIMTRTSVSLSDKFYF
jgi:hypothetical protein